MTSEASALAASVRELLDKHCDSAALRAAWDSDDGRVPGLWQRLGEMGVTEFDSPAEFAEFGIPVLTEIGRAAAPEPLLELLLAAMLGSPGGVVAANLGPGALVTAGSWADLFVLRDEGGAVHAVAASDVVSHEQVSLDRGVRLATVEWTPGVATHLADAPVGDAVADASYVGAAAMLVGLAEALLAMAVRYAGQREQFGRAIGSFQAVKHHLADVYVAVEFAKPVIARASSSIAHEAPTRARDASHAKLAATAAAQRAARTALQVHGGIGYTYEHDLHMWLKRTLTLSSLWGDATWHRARVAQAVLGE